MHQRIFTSLAVFIAAVAIVGAGQVSTQTLPAGNGDLNGDSVINVSDVFYFINFLFAGGPAPIPTFSPRRTVFVGPVGTPTESGAAVLNALDGIVAASDGSPWLLKIEPGIYDLGSTPLQMKDFVDVEGSGEGITTLLGTSSGGAPIAGTVVATSSSELRDLTVLNYGGGQGSQVHVAVYIGAGSPRLTNVTAEASCGDYAIGVYNIYGNPILARVTARAHCLGAAGGTSSAIFNTFGSPTLIGVTAWSDGTALFNDRGNATIRDSTLRGGTRGIWSSTDSGSPGSFLVTVDGSRISGNTHSITSDSATGSEMAVHVGASQLVGGPVAGSGIVRCVAVYDAGYQSAGLTVCP